MKNVKVYIIYIVIILVLSFGFDYAWKAWKRSKALSAGRQEYTNKLEKVKPFLEKQFVLENWQVGDGLTLHDFGTFSMGLPDNDMKLVVVTVLPNGNPSPQIIVGTENAAIKFTQPTTVNIQKQELEELKKNHPDNENIQAVKMKTFDSFKTTLDTSMLNYEEFVKLSEDEMKDYIARVNDKASILQKAKDIVLFETENLKGAMLQVQGVYSAKDGADEPKAFANAEISVWSKTGDITQKFIVSGKPGELAPSIELLKLVVPSVNYAGREVMSPLEQMKVCLEKVSNMKWFQVKQLQMAAPDNNTDIPAGPDPVGGIGLGN